MYTTQPKKLLIINILDILEKYTDEDHKLSQRQIEDILAQKYMMKVERKTVRRNLMELIDSEYVRIGYTESSRTARNQKTGEADESRVLTDFYLIREFTTGELRYLVDSILSSRYIPERQGRDLISKLEKLGGIYFRSHSKHISRRSGSAVYSKEIFYNIEQLDNAISQHKKVKFNYAYFGEDKKPHLRLNNDGTVKQYIINPYQMAINSGKYYLICNTDKYDDIGNYRIDRIKNVEILDEPAKSLRRLKESEGLELDLNAYMDRHIYMFSGRQSPIKFKVVKEMVGDVIDVFGTGFTIYGSDDKCLTLVAKVSEDAMLQYAKAFAPDIIVLEPQRLADRIKEQLQKAVESYN